MMVIYKVCEDWPLTSKELYIEKNGKHFSKNLCEWAVSLLTPGERITKSTIDKLLTSHDLVLNNNELYDYVYIANEIKLHNSEHSAKTNNDVVMILKDIMDNNDAFKGLAFTRFCSDMEEKEIEIDWKELM